MTPEGEKAAYKSALKEVKDWAQAKLRAQRPPMRLDGDPRARCHFYKVLLGIRGMEPSRDSEQTSQTAGSSWEKAESISLLPSNQPGSTILPDGSLGL